VTLKIYGELKREVTLPESQFIFHRALGQGAFGEVYQGFFRHRVGDAVEMPVAVKVC
jgi:anaplastic lymphoma kinase